MTEAGSAQSASAPVEPYPCEECEGAGWLTLTQPGAEDPERERCESCEGTGTDVEGLKDAYGALLADRDAYKAKLAQLNGPNRGATMPADQTPAQGRRKVHALYHAGSALTACGRKAAGLDVKDARPTCKPCLKVWRADHFDPHDAASSGAVR